MSMESKCLQWWARELRTGVDKLLRLKIHFYEVNVEIQKANEICEGENVKKKQKTPNKDINPPVNYICSKHIRIESNI